MLCVGLLREKVYACWIKHFSEIVRIAFYINPKEFDRPKIQPTALLNRQVAVFCDLYLKCKRSADCECGEAHFEYHRIIAVGIVV